MGHNTKGFYGFLDFFNWNRYVKAEYRLDPEYRLDQLYSNVRLETDFTGGQAMNYLTKKMVTISVSDLMK